jgi:amino-acid N-acetyltransferase
MIAVRLRNAGPEDPEIVTTFLTAAGLPAAGVAEHLGSFLIAEKGKEWVLRLVLLTTTAERYFVRKGFVRIDRSALSGPITGSKEFTGACASNAVCMELSI